MNIIIEEENYMATPTTTERPRTIEEIDRDLSGSREAMSEAARELEAADVAVEEARERQGLARIHR